MERLRTYDMLSFVLNEKLSRSFLGHVEHLKGTFEDVKDQDIGDIFLAVYSMLYAYSGG